MVCLMEDTGNALQLKSCSIPKTLQQRTFIQGSIPSYWTSLPVIKEVYLAILFERQSQGAVFTSSDICPYFNLSGIVCIERKCHSPDTQFRALKMLKPKKSVTNQFKPEQAPCRMFVIGIEAPEHRVDGATVAAC